MDLLKKNHSLIFSRQDAKTPRKCGAPKARPKLCVFASLRELFYYGLASLRVVFWCLFFILLCVCAMAQDRAHNRSQFLVPQTVYVGDRAVLTLPLTAPLVMGDITLDSRALAFLSSPELDIHRVVLENRPPGSRLVIEFTAFAPGLLELPPIEIGGQSFSGINVEISSILDGSDATVLSSPLPPLSIPGTSFFIYGTITGLILLLLLVLLMVFWGRLNFSKIAARWKRLRLIAAMAKIEKRLAKILDSGDKWAILDKLSTEFRIFLSLFTGENCRAMTAGEFGRLPFPESFAGMPPEWGSGFLKRFFMRCDDFRFGGGKITSADIAPLLTELRQFLDALNSAVRSKTNQTGERE